MDEGRKRVLLIAASILAARKLAQFDGGKRVPATISAIADAVRWAEEIMKAIDDRWRLAGEVVGTLAVHENYEVGPIQCGYCRYCANTTSFTVVAQDFSGVVTHEFEDETP